MATPTRLSCPSWCTVSEHKDDDNVHIRYMGSVSDVAVSVCQDTTSGPYTKPWPEPKVIVVASYHLGHMSSLREAPRLAHLFDVLGHKKLAALVREAVETARVSSVESAS